MNLVIGTIVNPKVSSTSYFILRTLYGDVITDRNEVFGYLSFAPPPCNI